MQAGGRRLIRHWPDTDDQRQRLLAPRDDLLLETTPPDSKTPRHGEAPDDDRFQQRFVQADGPFSTYQRTVERTADGLTETTKYRLLIPWFGWLFAFPVRRVLARKGSHQSWWAPPDRLDDTQVLVIGLLAAASMSAAFVNTLFTQTVNFAADDFGVGNTGIGVAGAVVRAGIVISLPAAVMADRIGRRRVIVAVAWLGPLLSLAGALAPSFVVLTATQTLARPMGIALAFLVGVVASEEMPRNSRAYAVSVLAMAAGFGAGIAVLSLRLADLGSGGWRYVYVIATVWCIVALDLSRRLPETRRFTAISAPTSTPVSTPAGTGINTASSAPTGTRPGEAIATRIRTAPDTGAARRAPRLNRRRLLLVGAVGFIGNIFIAPASFFQNRYLTDIRDFSGGMIGIFSIGVGTPAVIGLILGGRIADTSGRRRLIAITLPLGTAAIVGAFAVGGPMLWVLSLAGGIVSSAAYPALAVYRSELFPTGNRSRAAGIITASALIGGIGGLLATGALIDAGWSYAAVMAVLALCQVAVTVIVVVAYPETAHLELEQLNPEDASIDLREIDTPPIT